MKYRLRLLRAWGPAILSTLLLIVSLLLLWVVTDFPLPAEATLRRLEEQSLLPHGTTLASGTVELEPFSDRTPRFTWTLRGNGEQSWALLTESFGFLSRPYLRYIPNAIQAECSPFWGALLELQTFSTFSPSLYGPAETNWATQFFLLAHTTDSAVVRVEAQAGWQEEAGKTDALAAEPLIPAEGCEGVWTGLLTQNPSANGRLVWRLRAYDKNGTLLYEECSDSERFSIGTSAACIGY